MSGSSPVPQLTSGERQARREGGGTGEGLAREVFVVESWRDVSVRMR